MPSPNPDRIALGTVQLGLPYGITNQRGQPSKEVAFELLDEALKSGITTWDTARAYGESEHVLGEYLKSKKLLTAPLLITKIAPLNGRGLAGVKKSIEESIEALGRLPDFALFHEEKDLLDSEEAWSYFDALEEEGIAAGFSSYDPEKAVRILKEFPVALIQAPIHLLDHRYLSDEFLSALYNRDAVFHARSVFLQGLFYLEEVKLPPSLSFAEKTFRDLHSLAKDQGRELWELALGFAFSQSDLDQLVLGFNHADELKSTLTALSKPFQKYDAVFEKKLSEILGSMDPRLPFPTKWPK